MEWNFVCSQRWMGAVAQSSYMFGVFIGAVTLGSIEKNEDAQSPLSVRKPSDIPIINTAASSEGEISPEDSPIDLNEIK
jgi:hypothetical protein